MNPLHFVHTLYLSRAITLSVTWRCHGLWIDHDRCSSRSDGNGNHTEMPTVSSYSDLEITCNVNVFILFFYNKRIFHLSTIWNISDQIRVFIIITARFSDGIVVQLDQCGLVVQSAQSYYSAHESEDSENIGRIWASKAAPKHFCIIPVEICVGWMKHVCLSVNECLGMGWWLKEDYSSEYQPEKEATLGWSGM